MYKNILPQQHICIQSSAQELSIAVLSVFNLLLDRDFRKLIDNNYINFRNSTRADFSQKNYLRVHDNAFPIQKQQKAAISHSFLEQRKIIQQMILPPPTNFSSDLNMQMNRSLERPVQGKWHIFFNRWLKQQH